VERAVGIGISRDGIFVIELSRGQATDFGRRAVVAATIGGLGYKKVGLQSCRQLLCRRRERERKGAVVRSAFAVEGLPRVAKAKLVKCREVNQSLSWPGLAAIKGGIESRTLDAWHKRTR
jgi:hypothetical protein